MSELCISVDSTTPVTQEQKERYNIIETPLKYTIDGQVYTDVFLDEVEKHTFYAKVKAGATVDNAELTPEVFIAHWRQPLAQGKTILHLSFSAKLSQAYDMACLARDILSKDYPSKIKVVDTRIWGYAITEMAVKAAQMFEMGKAVEDIVLWVDENRMRYNLLITVDDISHLQRSGKLSRMVTFMVSKLNVKPVLYVNSEGKTGQLDTCNGMSRAMDAMVSTIENNASENTTWVRVQHGGDEAVGLNFVDKVRSRLKNIEHIEISMLSPVLGLDSGPGALSVYFETNDRNLTKAPSKAYEKTANQ